MASLRFADRKNAPGSGPLHIGVVAMSTRVHQHRDRRHRRVSRRSRDTASAYRERTGNYLKITFFFVNFFSVV